MMGEITATLKGSMKVSCECDSLLTVMENYSYVCSKSACYFDKVTTVLDFLLLFIRATTVTHRTQCLAEYLCELSLLQSDLGDYSQAQVIYGCMLF